MSQAPQAQRNQQDGHKDGDSAPEAPGVFRVGGAKRKATDGALVPDPGAMMSCRAALKAPALRR
jgi:hypothetical protein